MGSTSSVNVSFEDKCNDMKLTIFHDENYTRIDEFDWQKNFLVVLLTYRLIWFSKNSIHGYRLKIFNWNKTTL